MRAKVENTVVFQKSMFSVLPGQWERARKSFIEEMLPGNPKRKSILGRSNSIRKSSDVRLNMIKSGNSKKFIIMEMPGMKHDKARAQVGVVGKGQMVEDCVRHAKASEHCPLVQ